MTISALTENIPWLSAALQIVDILAVAFIIYKLYKIIAGTRTIQLLIGIVLMLVVYMIANVLQLRALRGIMEYLFPILPVIMIVLFQPELRRIFRSIGEFRFFGFLYKSSVHSYSDIIIAVTELSRQKIGALIVIRRRGFLRTIIENGIRLDAQVTAALLLSIFTKKTPLHDGAVIIEDNRIAAASCYLPLSKTTRLSKKYGTRHRAALGLSEQSDAIIIVISEETGKISLAVNGRLNTGYSPDELRTVLNRLIQ